ncbi:MAG TPA: hypothetical protein VK718_11750 [Ferruginibacter sp.]|jgi:hypothetical protein|nr:hypothetical protein [Ferruginibacter sp.]
MKNSTCIRSLCFLISLFMSASLIAQTNTIKYYDSSWDDVSKDSAFYYSQFTKQDTVYTRTSYWVRSNKVKSINSYSDSSFDKPKGLSRTFYENGSIEDSVYYTPTGSEVAYNFYKSGQLADSSVYSDRGDCLYARHYYENGNLWVNYYYSTTQKKEITEAYDITGKKINNFIYKRQSSLPGGVADWSMFCRKNLNPDVPVDNGAPVGTYKVKISFTVNKDGTISSIRALTHLGYGMENEVIRIIKKSPNWLPAIELNEIVSSRKIQPVMFVVSGDR